MGGILYNLNPIYIYIYENKFVFKCKPLFFVISSSLVMHSSAEPKLIMLFWVTKNHVTNVQHFNSA